MNIITALRLSLSAFAVATSFLMLLSCSNQSVDLQHDAATYASTGPSSHILAPTELIDIKVFQEPELNTTARIADNGRIMMPMIGEIQVGGKTVPEATQLIRQRLEARFIKNPQVTLTVIDYAKKMFTILGQVQRPGTFRFPDRESINLIQAIGIAGGYTPIGDPAKITLKRVVNGKPTVLKLDAKRMARDNTLPVEIQSGDIITVGERLF
jgi:polysaccharide export outer membrane protein